MDAALAPADRRVRVRGLELAVRQWPGGAERPFLLVHGLASNARTWDAVAALLHAAGHPVVSVDQRGHGRSDKPESGYGFEEVASDLAALIEALALEQPIVAGQSWGGNVVLDFAARWPDALGGLVLVDGGFIDISDRDWEQVSSEMKPPNLLGTPRQQMFERMRSFRPDWPDEAIEMQMANYETLADGTIRPWLSLDRHMQILRALWEQRPAEIYPRVTTPTLIAVADSQNRSPRRSKEDEVGKAEAALLNARVRWFADTAHDIHVHRPQELAAWMLDHLAEGFFRP